MTVHEERSCRESTESYRRVNLVGEQRTDDFLSNKCQSTSPVHYSGPLIVDRPGYLCKLYTARTDDLTKVRDNVVIYLSVVDSLCYV